MHIPIIISAFLFVVYLQTGLLVLWKNRESRLNRLFFFIAVYLSGMSALSLLILPLLTESFYFGIFMRISWSMLPIMIFRFHYLLTGIPSKRNNYEIWHYAFLFTGLIIGLFALSIVFGTDAESFQKLTDWLFLRLIWNHLFTALVLAFFISITYQYVTWRRQVRWRKERLRFGLVYYSFFLIAFTDLIFLLLMPGAEVIMYIKIPNIFLLPWFLSIVFGFVSYSFSPPDPAKAAKKLLQELPQILLICDRNVRVKVTNQFSMNLLEMNEDQISNIYLPGLFSDENRTKKIIHNVFSKEHAGPIALELINASGSKIPVTISCTLLKDRFDDLYGIAVYGKDNTEQLNLKNEIRDREQMEDSLRLMRKNLEHEIYSRTLEMRHSLEEAETKMVARLENEKKIKNEIREMEVMMNEIHTRITKNIKIVLSMLKNIAPGSFSKDDINQVQTLHQRIESIFLVNTQVQSHNRYGLVDFRQYLRLLIDSYSENHGLPIQTDLNAKDELLWVDQAVPLALVANELMSVIHRSLNKSPIASKSSLIIKYYHSNTFDCNLDFLIQDINVSGCDSDKVFNGSQIELARMLVADQLGGTLKIKSFDNGCSVSIRIPGQGLRQGHLGLES